MKRQGISTSIALPGPAAATGFTLLELVIAMAMVAMLSLTLYTSLTIAITGKRAAERAIRPTRTVAVAIDLIGRDLEALFPPNATNRDDVLNNTTTENGTLPFFGLGFYGTNTGGGSNLQVCCVGTDGTPGVPLSEGIRQVELTVANDEKGGVVLVRRVNRNLLNPNPVIPADEILCRNVQSFTARYFDGTSWYEEWDSDSMSDTQSNPAVPMAVELTVVLTLPDPQKPESTPRPYQFRRVIPIACAKPVASTTQ
jgi:prepilin-type N-terminal cleavage/methylation domain-containing protein